MSNIRVGVVGLGRLADNVRIPILRSLPGIEIAAVCDTDEKRLESISEKYGILGRYRDHGDMIADASIDAAFVVASPPSVAPVAYDCLSSGIPTFMEKPPGLTTKDARELLATARQHDVIAMVGFNRRFQPLVREAKRMVESEGPIFSLIVEFHPFNFEHYKKSGFSEESLTHFHAAQSIHAVDLIRYLGGDVATVQSTIGNLHTSYGDSLNALIGFKDGATGNIICNYTSPTRIERAELIGDGILVELHGTQVGHSRPSHFFESATVYKKDLTLQVLNAAEDNPRNAGFYQEVEYFVDCIRADSNPGRPGADLEDALKTMELVEMILASWKRPTLT